VVHGTTSHRLNRKDFAFGAKTIAYDGRPVWERVKCPVLVVVGERDTIVPSKESAATIEALLRHAGNPTSRLRWSPTRITSYIKRKRVVPERCKPADQLKAFAPDTYRR